MVDHDSMNRRQFLAATGSSAAVLAGAGSASGQTQNGDHAFLASLSFPSVYRPDGEPVTVGEVSNGYQGFDPDRKIVLPSKYSGPFDRNGTEVYRAAFPYQLVWRTSAPESALGDVKMYCEFDPEPGTRDEGYWGRSWPTDDTTPSEPTQSAVWEWKGGTTTPGSGPGKHMNPEFTTKDYPANYYRPVDIKFTVDFTDSDVFNEQDTMEYTMRAAVPNKVGAGLTRLVWGTDLIWETTVQSASNLTKLPLDKLFNSYRERFYATGRHADLIDPSNLAAGAAGKGIGAFLKPIEEAQNHSIESLEIDNAVRTFSGPLIARHWGPPSYETDDGTTYTPRDLDGDGLYRDFNGDGSVSQTDVQRFFEEFYLPKTKERWYLFDYNGNGQVGHGDVLDLFEYVSTQPL